MYSDDIVMHAARRCVASLKEAGVIVSASVRESTGAIDLALADLNQLPVVVRCVERHSADDFRALQLMIAQGDFTRAAIVYTAENQHHISGEIEAYPLSQVDELAASLARDRPP